MRYAENARKLCVAFNSVALLTAGLDTVLSGHRFRSVPVLGKEDGAHNAETGEHSIHTHAYAGTHTKGPTNPPTGLLSVPQDNAALSTHAVLAHSPALQFLACPHVQKLSKWHSHTVTHAM